MKVNPIKFEKKLFVALADNVPFDIKCDTNYKTPSGGVIKAICVKDVAVSVDDEDYCGVYKNDEMMKVFNYGLYHNEASICAAIVLAVYEQLNFSEEDVFSIADIKTHLLQAKGYYKKELYFWEQLVQREGVVSEYFIYPKATKNIEALRELEQNVEQLLNKIEGLE